MHLLVHLKVLTTYYYTCRVYTELAAYKSIEGDQSEVLSISGDLYMEARLTLDKVVRQLQMRRMEKSSMAARTFNSYAILMKSWGNLL